MFLFHLPETWPQVQSGQLAAAQATLGKWFNISDAAISEYGDVALGIFDNTVVTAFDLTGVRERDVDKRVTFEGKPSAAWNHLIGTPNPGKPWGVRGRARPVQYLHTAVVAAGTVPVASAGAARRAVVDGFTLTVGDDGTAVPSMPAGRTVTIVTGEA
ncbi:hypothetical protein [Streptomyces sp. NPDC056242]|uniref:hypothetical protein n=1 Tax=Streptomyces sp. NPDC056242 TaxID=3345760 RepID=UPI0035E322E1